MRIFGLENIQEQLKRHMAEGRVKQAYLFAGPRSVGKMSLALWFARALQCPGNGCGVCVICQQIDNQSHTDTFFYLDEGESFSVEEVRKITEQASRSGTSRHMIFILENIERMSISAANALLKTLEEPQPHIVFLLTASSTAGLLPTVLSRVSLYTVPQSRPSETLEYLQSVYLNETKAKLDEVVRLSFGRIGEAIRLLSETEYFYQQSDLYKNLQSLIQDRDIARWLVFFRTLQEKEDDVSSRDRVFSIVDMLTLILHDSMVGEVGSGKWPVASVAREMEVSLILSRLEMLSEVAAHARHNVDPKLLLTYVGVELSH